jgi:hypothetical protein
MGEVQTRGVTIIKESERVVKPFGCAYCFRDSLELTASGKLIWESPHRDSSGNREPHPNAMTINYLLGIYFSMVDAEKIRDVRQMAEDWLQKKAA